MVSEAVLCRDGIKLLAEEVGFEPTDEDHSSLVFKTSALNRSATLP